MQSVDFTRHPFTTSHSDSEILTNLIVIHAETDSPKILDCTCNVGKIWENTPYSPIMMDIDSKFGQITADAFAMPFPSGSFDVIVFDPPHLPNAGASSKGIMGARWARAFGIVVDQSRLGDNVSAMFIPFLEEAARVLRPGGIALVKIADIVHNHRYQWQHVDLIVSAKMAGLTPCDLAIRLNNGGMSSSKWESVKHLRRAHSYWIAIRNANYDEPRKVTKLNRPKQISLGL